MVNTQDASVSAVVSNMTERLVRIRQQERTLRLMKDSQRADALYLVDHSRLPLGKVAELCGVTRMTLNRWLAARELGRPLPGV